MKSLIILSFFLLVAGCNRNVKQEYYKDGSVFMKYHVNEKGQKHGEWLEFYPDGDTLIKCNYLTDKLNGTFSKFYVDNQAYYSVEYEEGRLININYYHLKDGTLINQSDFKDGNGIISVYEPESGALLSKRTYLNGLPHGMKYIYFSSGGIDSVMVDSSKVRSYSTRNLPPFD